MRTLIFVVFLLFVLLGLTPPVLSQTLPKAHQNDDPRVQVCQLIEEAARAHDLPIDFFARLIWQESHFQPDEVGPLTHGGRALGIAQFMPGTAIEQHLYEPFDPAEALTKSGEFLSELRNEFGNLGLAAAGYNAGPQRVRDYLADLRDLPAQTRNYVLAITGRSVEEWRLLAAAGATDQTDKKDQPAADRPPPNCHDLVATLEYAPSLSADVWPGHKVPSWCHALHHPNTSVCGPVHMRTLVLNVAHAMFPHTRSALRVH